MYGKESKGLKALLAIGLMMSALSFAGCKKTEKAEGKTHHKEMKHEKKQHKHEHEHHKRHHEEKEMDKE